MKKLSLIIAAVICIGLASCSKNDQQNPRLTFVLVHGAWQAPYAWQYVKADLEAKGQRVVVVELPGHGSDQTAPQTIHLNDYRNKVISVINAIDGPVILVGHSLAGMVISAVAEKIPARISKMVYLGAYLPLSGQSLLGLASTDTASILGKSLVSSPTSPLLQVKRDSIIKVFIQDGSDAIKQLVLTNYRDEPAPPFLDTVSLTKTNYGSVNKYYIHTLQDHAITLKLQNRMIAAAGLKNIYQINTSHCAFLAKPDSVSILLLKIAQ